MGVMAARKSAVSKAGGKAKGAAKPAGKGGAQLKLVALPPAKKEARVSAPLAKPAQSKKSAPAKAAAPAKPQPELLPAPEVEAKPEKGRRRATAEQMATKQREISISEFFTKNRHLLGFDNPSKALLTTVKEAVDNSLDACEEAGILPDLRVELVEMAEEGHRRRHRGQRSGDRQGAGSRRSSGSSSTDLSFTA